MTWWYSKDRKQKGEREIDIWKIIMSLQYDRLPQNTPSDVPLPIQGAGEEQFVLVTPPNPTAEEFKQTILNRRVEFNISRYVHEGWQFTKYNLCHFVGITLIYVAVAIGLWVLLLLALNGRLDTEMFTDGRRWEDGKNDGYSMSWDWNTRTVLISLGFNIAAYLLFYFPSMASLFKAVFNAMRANTKIRFADFFSCFTCPYFFRLMGLGILLALMREIGFWMLVVPGVYISLATLFSVPMHGEQQAFIGIWDSIIFSAKIFNRYWCSILGLLLCLGCLQILGALCFGVGLFVTIPVAFNSLCYCYHHLVGVNGVAVMVPLTHLEGTPAPSTPVIVSPIVGAASDLPAPSAPSASLV